MLDIDDDEEHLIKSFSSKLQMMGVTKDELKTTAKRLVEELKASSSPGEEPADESNPAENNHGTLTKKTFHIY